MSVHGKFIWNAKDDTDEDSPKHGYGVDSPPEPAITHVERAWFELHLGMIAIDPPATWKTQNSELPTVEDIRHVQYDSDHVREVEGHGRRGIHGVQCNRASKVEEAR